MEDCILTRTETAFGKELMKEFCSLCFCIVGCGGTGATFAEMLVRSGAKTIHLIDGEEVKITDLNRIFGFVSEDVGKKKVDVLKNRLMSIVSDVIVHTYPDHFRRRENIVGQNSLGQKVRDCVHDAEVVFIGTDNNKSRIACEELCCEAPGKLFLSCGIHVGEKESYYECVWKPKTPIDKQEAEGYGENNGSYISIVTEATSVAFSMLIHHLKNPQSTTFRKYYKEYYDFVPQNNKLDNQNFQLQ